MAESEQKFKGIARREYWSNYNVLCINGFVSTSSTDEWKVFFLFQISKFWAKTNNLGRKLKNIQKNSEAWILIKLKCVIYQWIRLDKLFKLANWTFFFFNSVCLTVPRSSIEWRDFFILNVWCYTSMDSS